MSRKKKRIIEEDDLVIYNGSLYKVYSVWELDDHPEFFITLEPIGNCYSHNDLGRISYDDPGITAIFRHEEI